MKKLLFSILIILGLSIIGCGKGGETGSVLSKEDKSRPKLELQDVNFDGKTVKQIVIIPADEEEQAKLYERALESQEEFAKTFPNLQEEAKTTIFEGLRSKSRNSEFFIFVSKMTNLENTYQDFIKNNKDARKYSLNGLFYTDVKNANTIAWEMDKTVHVVEKTMNNNNILITRRTSEQKGALYDATVYKAKIAAEAKEGTYYPLKTTDSKIKDVGKYGGFTKIKIAYYSIFEYILDGKKGKQKITRIVPIPIYISQNIKDDKALLEYAQTRLPGKDLKIKYRKLCIGSLVKINNFNYYIGGKTNNNFTFDSAVQVILDKDSESYIKELAKYLNWKKENKDGKLWESITEDKNIQLYDSLVKKMNTGIFIRKTPNKYTELLTLEVKNKFINIDIDEQVKLLLEILNLLTNKKFTSKLNEIGITASRGICSFNLSNQSQFSIIEQSVTGVYEKEKLIIEKKKEEIL